MSKHATISPHEASDRLVIRELVARIQQGRERQQLKLPIRHDNYRSLLPVCRNWCDQVVNWLFITPGWDLQEDRCTRWRLFGQVLCVPRSSAVDTALEIWHQWIIPKWSEHLLSDIRTIEVESWLRSLPIARSTCAKIRNVMSVLFNHARRYEFFDRNPIRLVRQSAKRRSPPPL